MAMPLFYLDGAKRLSVSPSFWIYVVIAVPLTCLTVGLWRLMLELKRRKRKEALNPDHKVSNKHWHDWICC